jgi:hypothetical protein
MSIIIELFYVSILGNVVLNVININLVDFCYLLIY